MFIAALVACLIGLQILGRAVYFAIMEAKSSEYTSCGETVRYTWRDFPQFLDNQTHRIIFGYSAIAIAIMFFCVGVFFL